MHADSVTIKDGAEEYFDLRTSLCDPGDEIQHDVLDTATSYMSNNTVLNCARHSTQIIGDGRCVGVGGILLAQEKSKQEKHFRFGTKPV